MGLFGKLFSKEACIVCGNEAGSLKRKRLGDEAIICKDCAKGLSPWFGEYKESTTESIKSQLEAREQNRARLPQFRVDYCLGEGDALLIDLQQKLFCVVGNAGGQSLSSGSQLVNDNPDLVSVDAIESIEIEGAGWSGHEIKHTVDGEQVSYEPRRYEYPCNVRMTLKLDHPYIRQMSVQFNRGTINIQTEGERLRDRDVLWNRTAAEATADWLFNRDRRVENNPEAWVDNTLEAKMMRPIEQSFGDVLDDHPDYAYGFKCSRENWHRIQEYTRCMQTAEAARALLKQMQG